MQSIVANKGPEELLAQIKYISKLCNGKPFGVGKSKPQTNLMHFQILTETQTSLSMEMKVV